MVTVDDVLAAHGGLDRWREFSTIEATIISGGRLWQIKGQPQDPAPRRMTVALQREWASVQPFGAADQKTETGPNDFYYKGAGNNNAGGGIQLPAVRSSDGTTYQIRPDNMTISTPGKAPWCEPMLQYASSS